MQISPVYDAKAGGGNTLRWPTLGGSRQTLTLLVLRNAQDAGMPMKEVPDWVFRTLKECRLQVLDLGGCSSLTTLPDAIGQLSSLKKLSLSDCSSVTCLPRTICQLTALTYIVLSGCAKLDSLPHSDRALAHKAAKCRRNESNHGTYTCMGMCCYTCRPSWFKPKSWLKLIPSLLGSEELWGLVQYILAGAVMGLMVWISRQKSKLKELNLNNPWPELTGCAVALVMLFLVQLLVRAYRERKTDVRVELCLVDTSGSALPQKHVKAGREEDTLWELRDLVAKIASQGRVLAFQRLLRDSEGRQASLEKLSFVAAALAAAARLTSNMSADKLNADAAKWLDVFRTSQQISFVLSMTLIMFVFVGAIPANEIENELARVGAVWVQFAVGGCLLLAALVLSVLSFFALAFVVDAADTLTPIDSESLNGSMSGDPSSTSTETSMHSIEWVFIGACWLLVLVLYAWWYALKRLWPGWKVVWTFFAELFASHLMGKESSVCDPPRGSQQVLKEIEGIMQGVLQSSTQQVALLQPVSSTVKAWASEREPEGSNGDGGGGGGSYGGGSRGGYDGDDSGGFGGGSRGGSSGGCGAGSGDDPPDGSTAGASTSGSVSEGEPPSVFADPGYGGLPGYESETESSSTGLSVGGGYVYPGSNDKDEDLEEDGAARTAAAEGPDTAAEGHDTAAEGPDAVAECPDAAEECPDAAAEGPDTAAEGAPRTGNWTSETLHDEFEDWIFVEHAAGNGGSCELQDGSTAQAMGLRMLVTEGSNSSAEGPDAAAEVPNASGDAADSSQEIGAAQGSSSGQMVHPGGVPPSFSTEERLSPDQSKDLFITAQSTFPGIASGASMGNTSDSQTSGREEGSAAQASGAAAGPGVESARNDAEQPGGSGEAVNPVTRATREVSTGEVTVDLPERFIVRRDR